MNVGWSVVEMGNVGSDQLVHGPEGLEGLAGLDATTGEVPAPPQPRASVLADGGRRSTGDQAGTISINLETNDVPFQQPNPHTVPVEPPGHDWRAAIVDAGRWPIVALGVAAVLVAVFAAFISRNGQSVRGDAESTEAPSAVESASAPVVNQNAEAPTQGAIEPDPLTATDGSDVSSARSTGKLGPAEGSGFFTGQVVEPDRSLTGPDVDWVPTTMKSPTTKPPTTATTATTPSTASSSTTPATSATTVVVPEGIRVRAVGPGTADADNPVVVNGDRVTLEAEGSDDNLRYRFVLSVRDDSGDWRQVDRSGWRSRPNWTVKTNRLEGRTVRWTVVGIDRSRDVTDESAPLYFRVGGGEDEDEDEDED